MSEIGNQLIKATGGNELKNISKEMIEAIMDSKMHDGLLKEIPIVSSVMSGISAISNIKDRLFEQKLLSFLHELAEINPDQIVEQVIKLEDDNKYRTKVGQKLLYIIDSCEDQDKAALTGLMFKAYLRKDIDYEDFLRSATAIGRIPLPDLAWFVNNESKEIPLDGGGSEFVTYGLMDVSFDEPRIKVDESNLYRYDGHEPSTSEDLQHRIKITGFKITAVVSILGDMLRKHLKNS